MRIGSWKNVGSVYGRSDNEKYIYRCKLHLLGRHEVRLPREGTAPEGEYTFVYGKGNENHELGTN
jgi:hypothetical protein